MRRSAAHYARANALETALRALVGAVDGAMTTNADEVDAAMRTAYALLRAEEV